MLWLVVLHIVAVMCWCAAQLYLPALIAGVASEYKTRGSAPESTGMPPALPLLISDIPRSLPRFVFTRIATPAALLAIVSGTVIFVLNRTLEVWFIAKLGLVTALVITHAMSGWLLLHAETRPGQRVVVACRFLTVALIVLMTYIIWLVLAKSLPAVLQ